MYHVNDTIVAIGSPTADHRVIIRISGPATVKTCKQIFSLDRQQLGLTENDKEDFVIASEAKPSVAIS